MDDDVFVQEHDLTGEDLGSTIKRKASTIGADHPISDVHGDAEVFEASIDIDGVYYDPSIAALPRVPTAQGQEALVAMAQIKASSTIIETKVAITAIGTAEEPDSRTLTEPPPRKKAKKKKRDAIDDIFASL